MLELFDSHAHLDFPDYDNDREQVLTKCREAGVSGLINIGTDTVSSGRSIRLAEKYPWIYATVGCHPHEAEHFDRAALTAMLGHPRVRAVGEIGLDYYRDLSPREVQREVFRSQIQMAREKGLPIVVHDRDAHEDCMTILDELKAENVVFHCFSGDESLAGRVLDRGWMISFTGAITYKNSTLDGVIRMVPRDRFMIETDAPYLTPVPFRGKRNAPWFLTYVVDKIARLKNVAPKSVAEASAANARRFFGI